MDLVSLERQASEVREMFENRDISLSKLIELYQQYNSLNNTEEFVKKSSELFPKLNCGLASLYVRDVLKQGEVVMGKYGNERHTFLLLNDGIIVDITADQYDGPKVYVGPLRKPWSI